MMPELKPCPFCGGEATVIQTKAYSTGVVLYHVWHYAFACPLREVRTENMETAEEAIEAWNRRHDPQELEFDYGAED